jgi:hypothetical protein
VRAGVDVVFVVDDSPSMAPAQTALVASLPAFADKLRALPGLQIAVVSSDMGGGDGSIPGCMGTGKSGVFQYAARGGCAATGLQAGATYLSNVGGVANYTGNMEDVLRCIVPLGETGCRFSHSFAALTRALGADGKGAAPSENRSFLRHDAGLAVVFVTNEDDCSVADGIPLFDTTQNLTLASQLGPPTNFRCNEFGHICEGGAPSRNSPNGQLTDTVTYQNCVSAEGSGLLKTVWDTAAQLKALKADPTKDIVVAALSGLATPYQVHWKSPAMSDPGGPWPEITHSCANDTTFGDPGVRLTELARQFGANGLTLSICESSLGPPLTRIGEAIAGLYAPPCIQGTVAGDPARGGTQPDCDVTLAGASGAPDAGVAVPSCADSGGVGPCWNLVPGGPTCSGQVLSLVAGPANAPPASMTVRCTLCTPGVPDPARNCP